VNFYVKRILLVAGAATTVTAAAYAGVRPSMVLPSFAPQGQNSVQQQTSSGTLQQQEKALAVSLQQLQTQVSDATKQDQQAVKQLQETQAKAASIAQTVALQRQIQQQALLQQQTAATAARVSTQPPAVTSVSKASGSQGDDSEGGGGDD